MWMKVFDDQHLKYEQELAKPIVLGRKILPTEPAYGPADSTPISNNLPRVTFADLHENAVSRACMELTPAGADRLRVKCLKTRLTVNGDVLQPGAECELPLPVIVNCLNKTVRIEADDENVHYDSLANPTIAPGMAARPLRMPDLNSGDALLEWFRTVTSILQSATESEDFFARAAQALVDLVDLSCGRVLLYERGTWQTAALALHEDAPATLRDVVPSARMLTRLIAERRTFWQTSFPETDASLTGIGVVVAAPILNRAGEVIGAVYGDRRIDWIDLTGFSRPLSALEAALVETLAGSVAAGLARLTQQRAALAAEVRFEQFFSPELSRFLTAQPDMLNGREAEVSLLFCDVRGFSQIAEQHGPATTLELMNDLLGVLSDCVIAQEGVLVDYIGDELLAMWGAPADQPDHATRACDAALDMLAALDPLNTRWKTRLGRCLRLGIGINTGKAQVGNTGSHRKFKYGPLGTAVNLASRVQGATKYLRTELLVTEFTRRSLGPRIRTRRVGKVQVINIARPIELFQLPAGKSAGWDKLAADYEQALADYEQQRFRESAAVLSRLIADYPDDGPSLALLARVVEAGMKPQVNFNAVWQLPGK